MRNNRTADVQSVFILYLLSYKMSYNELFIGEKRMPRLFERPDSKGLGYPHALITINAPQWGV